MTASHILADIIKFFDKIDEWIPGSSSTVGSFLLGKVPEADYEKVYDLSDAWSAARDQLNQYAEDIYRDGDPILAGWNGGGGDAFQQNWMQYLNSLRNTIQVYDGMSEMVNGYGLEIETEQFMIALNLIFLIGSLIAMIVSAFFTFGGSLGGAPAAFAVAREAIVTAAREAIEKIAEQGLKDTLLDLLRNLSLKNIVAKQVAERVAKTAFKDVLKDGLKDELKNVGTKEARNALMRAAYAEQKKLAEDLTARLVEKWGGRLTTDMVKNLAERGAEDLGEHVAEDGLERLGMDAMRKQLVDQLIEQGASKAFANQAAKYLISKVAMGAAFMGGQDLIVQGAELAVGDRTSFDGKEFAESAAQGAVMGGLMEGHTYVGQAFTGGLAGAGTAALGDAWQAFEQRNLPASEQTQIDWGGDMTRGAEQGATMGAFFHTNHAINALKENFSGLLNDRLGQETHLLLDDSGRMTLDFNLTTGGANPLTMDFSHQFGGDTHFTGVGEDGSSVTFTRDADGNQTVVRTDGPDAAALTGVSMGMSNGPDLGASSTGGGGGGGGGGVRTDPGTPRAGDGDRRTGTSPGEGDANRTDPGTTEPDGTESTGTQPGDTDQTGADQNDAGQNGTGQNGTGQNDAGQSSTGQHDAGQNGVGTDQRGTGSDGTRTVTGDKPAEQVVSASDPVPTDVARTDATPTDSAQTDLTRTDPAPTDVTRTDPAPTDVARTDATPTDSAQTDLTRTDPVPTDLAPADPVPTDVARTDATPTDSTQTDLTRTDPVPTDVARTDATPTDSAPTDLARTDPVLPEAPDERVADPSPEVVVADGGRTLVVTTSDMAGLHTDDPQLGDANLRRLDARVTAALDAAADPRNWVDGRPPRVEIEADHLDARIAFRLEHLTAHDGYDSMGRPVHPEVRVVGPIAHPESYRLAVSDGQQGRDLRGGVHYFTPAERENVRITSGRGLIRDRDGAPLDGTYLYVVEPDTGHVFAVSARFDGEVKHSSLLSGGATVAAGKMVVEDGRVVRIDAASGHYRPTPAHVWVARDSLARLGIDVRGTVLGSGMHDPHDFSTARGDEAYRSALDAVGRPGAIDGVARVEAEPIGKDSVPVRVGAQDSEPVSGSQSPYVRVTTDDGRTVRIDTTDIQDYLRETRPDGRDGDLFPADRQLHTSGEELGYQARDLLSDRIRFELDRSEPEQGPRPPLPIDARLLHDLDGRLAAALDRPPLHDGTIEVRPADDGTASAAIRSVSDAQIDRAVDASGLDPDRAAALRADLQARRDELVARYDHPSDEARQAVESRRMWAGEDATGKDLYDRLREVAYDAGRSTPDGLTVRDVARILDGSGPGEHGDFERRLDDYLSTDAGQRYHGEVTHLDLAGRPAEADFPRPSAADAAAARDRQSDWTGLQRDAADRFTTDAPANKYLRGEPTTPDAHRDAHFLRTAMRPTEADLSWDAEVRRSDLAGLVPEFGDYDRGWNDAALAALPGERLTFPGFVEGGADGRPSGLVLRIEAPRGTEAIWLDGPNGDRIVLAPDTPLRVLDVGRVDENTVVIRVRAESAGVADHGPSDAGRPDHGAQFDHGAQLDHGGHAGPGGHGPLVRTNADVLHNGGDVPRTLDEVYRVAESLPGVDLGGVRVDLIDHPADVETLDRWGAHALTPIEQRGRVVLLGPAAFADHDTLAATVAHEYKHVEQLRARGGRIAPGERVELENEARMAEAAVPRRLDALTEGETGADRAPGARGVPDDRLAGDPRDRLDPRDRDPATGDDAGGRDRGANNGAGNGVRDAGEPGRRDGDRPAGGPGSDAGAAGGHAAPGAAEAGTDRLLGDLPGGGHGTHLPTESDDGRHLAGPGGVDHGQSGDRAVGVRTGRGGDPALRSGVPGPREAADAARGGAGGGEPGSDPALGATHPGNDDRGTGRPPGLSHDDPAAAALDHARAVADAAKAEEVRTYEQADPALRHAIDSMVANAQEPAAHITDDLRRVSEPYGGKLVGLSHRVKSPGSLARKARMESLLSGEPPVRVIEGLKDLIRFSVALPEEGYSQALRGVLDGLHDLGYRPTDGDRPFEPGDARNMWADGNRFQGLLTDMRDPEGRPVEVQFPTERSYEAGAQTHDLYEIVRQAELPMRQRIDAYLATLHINKVFHLGEHLPDTDGLDRPGDTTFRRWVDKEPSVADFLSGPDGPDRTMLDTLRQRLDAFGLDAKDLGLKPDGHGDYHLSDLTATHEPLADAYHIDPEHPENYLARGGHDEELPPRGEYHKGLDFPTNGEPDPAAMPDHPNEVFGKMFAAATHVAKDQAADGDRMLAEGDPKGWFLKAYSRVTYHELKMIREGRYRYPIMKLQEVLAFHETYQHNLDLWRDGRLDDVEPNWRAAFGAADRLGRIGVLGSGRIAAALLPAIQAHVGFDLPRAIADVYVHVYEPRGVPFDDFRGDFDAMVSVFEWSAHDLMPEIDKATWPIDPGRFQVVQDKGFKLIYDLKTARHWAWTMAERLVDAHDHGIESREDIQHEIDAYIKAGNPLDHPKTHVLLHKITTYDWTDQPGRDVYDPDRPPVEIDDDYIKMAVTEQVGAHDPDLAAVINRLVDAHVKLNLIDSLHDGRLHHAVLDHLIEIAQGSDVDFNDLGDHPGTGPLFDQVPRDVNYFPGTGDARMTAFVDRLKHDDPALRVGDHPTDAEIAQVREYGDRLGTAVLPAVRDELDHLVTDLRDKVSGPVEVNARAKTGDRLLEKVDRMRSGRVGRPGRPGYEVGDVIDGVGARITVANMDALATVLDAVQRHFGTGDRGRILEVDNMYAAPKSKAPAYRVIPLVITIEVDGRPYTFELQLTTLRASVAADMEHNTLFKPDVPLSDEEANAVRDAYRQAAVLDQLEVTDRDE